MFAEDGNDLVVFDGYSGGGISGGSGTDTLVFKHILLQEAVYESMLSSQRRRNHLAVVQALEAQNSDTSELQPEVLARHYEEAGEATEFARKAIDYWLEAAQLATHRKAIVEAGHFLDNALGLVERLETIEDRDATELTIQTQRFPVLVALRGYSSESMKEASERALELCDRVSGFESRFAALFAVCIVYMVAARHTESKAVALRIAEITSDQDIAYRLEANMLLGLTSFFLGELVAAEKELTQSLDQYDIEAHGDHCYLFGQDPSVIALSYLVWIYFSQGNTSQLDITLKQLAERAEELNHPNSMGFALSFSAWECVFSERFEELEPLLEKMSDWSEKYGLVSFQIHGEALRGLLDFHRGDCETSPQRIHQALLDWEGIGSRCYLPLWYCFYAGVCMATGDLAAAEKALDYADNLQAEAGENWFGGEILNRRAELALHRSEMESAREYFERAISLSLASGAIGWGTYSALKYLDYSVDGGEALARESLEKLRQASPQTSFDRLNPKTGKLDI